MPRACFFARVRDAALFEIVDWYRADIRILSELGFEVTTARTWSEIPWNSDLYFTWWWGSGALALAKSRLLGRPNIFTGTLQLTPELDWWQELGPVKQAVVRGCLGLSSANLAISDAELAHLRRLGAPRCETVTLGVDSDFYRPATAISRQKLVIIVSHLTRENVRRKCVDTFIWAVPRVLERHPDARFRVIGGKEDGYPELAHLTESLGVASVMEFTGRISTDEKRRQYQIASVLAQTTIYEGFGMSIAEAMSCGLPIVSSWRGSIPELVGDCGRFVEPRDAIGMAAAITELLDDPAAAVDLGRRGRARIVERFSHTSRRRRLASVIARVMPDWQPPEGIFA